MKWYMRGWTIAAGKDAATPIRPNAKTAENEAQIQSSRARGGQSSRQPEGMILRMWRGRSSANKADEYIHHARDKVFPKLRAIEGNRGAYLLRRMSNGAVEFVVLTLWESMEAVRKFAGAEPAKAVVEPEAQSMLSQFDEFATHFEVVHRIE